MILGYLKNNRPNEVIDLFNKIENPNEVIFNLLFNACSMLQNKESLILIKQISSRIPNSVYSDPRRLILLIDASMKCGDIETAEMFFNKSTNKTIYMYGAMMTGKNIFVRRSIG